VLENITEDKKFAELMQKTMIDLIVLLFEKEQNFGVLCNVQEVSFNPELPDDIRAEFRPMTLFFLAGYTFETAHIEDDHLVFEAGFGRENIGSVVSIPLLGILQIIVEETPIFINVSNYKEEIAPTVKEVDENGVQNSMASFLNNPENAKFLK